MRNPIEVRTNSGEWREMDNAEADVWGILEKYPHMTIELRVNPKKWMNK